ncbi:uncharacterized protein TEOVI_000156900 [Trypanosoma equiperdum]|uniref:Uncharacterized protein n=1 Tax=Trypanosoma equiperdum TaxID=5694 RepID=A0A1G4ICN4_TRYEQ|nr:hypothetical protein, conserved [Trypanosoma equiperdum]
MARSARYVSVMASLLQQLQHVLQPWDGLGEFDYTTSALLSTDRAGDSRSDVQKNSFASAEGGATAGGGGSRSARFPAIANGSLWGADMESACEGGELSVPPRRPTGSMSQTGHAHRRDIVTKLELARAALALFTSNAGMYRPVLGKTLGFVFELVDELLQENAQLRECQVWGQQSQQRQRELGEADAAEVAAVHEKMRVMEAHMAKLVEESSTQRDHLKAEIAACHEREKKLEMLLEHQMMLTHASGLHLDGSTIIGKGLRDAEYVRRLVARAMNEKALDDLQQELEALVAEQEQLRKRTHDLLELNGMYARQSIALSTRLSILGDYNVAIAVETQKIKNDFIIEKRKCEKYRLDLLALRNVVMASFSNRNEVQRHWADIRNRQLEKEAETLLKLRAVRPPNNTGKERDDMPETTTSRVHSPIRSVAVSLTPSRTHSPIRSVAASRPPDERCQAPASTFLQSTPLHVPGMGCGAHVPGHLRTANPVRALRIDPIFVERQVCILLWEWRKQGMEEPLDTFTRDYFINFLQSGDEGGSSVSGGECGVGSLEEAQKGQLQLSYAFDEVSRSKFCGPLTRAYGLVTRKEVNKNLIRMLELDTSMLLAIFRFLDLKRNGWTKPSGIVPVMEFANVLCAMYPSYPLDTIKELVDAAVGLGGSASEFPGHLCYDVLLPERLFMDSEAMLVDGFGASPQSGFVHLFNYLILGDVEDSWRRIEDSFFFLQSPTGLVSEQSLFYRGFSELPEVPAIIWTPALRAVLSSWEVLKVNRGPLDLIEVLCVSLPAALEFLRCSTIPRRGTHPTRTSLHESYINDLYKDLIEVNPRLGRGPPPSYYASLVRRLDSQRHAVWGPQDVHAGDSLRYMSDKESLTPGSLLERLMEAHRNSENSPENLRSGRALPPRSEEVVA